MRGYYLTGSIPRLNPVDLAEPSPGPNDVVVEVAAVSLNYRDLSVASATVGIVPLSDGAGVIVAVGNSVADRRVGERVVIGFMPGWIDGSFTMIKQASSLGGGDINGVLAERIVVPSQAVVPINDAMSFEEAACLPCAGVTAWAALFERRPLLPGETLLLLGTGGVSIFALQFAKRAGARVIITSSSDAKLARAAALGADILINYARTPDWETEVLRLTDGQGADIAVDVGGSVTLNSSVNAVRADGRISLVGILTGLFGEIDTLTILRKRITIQGIYVGPVSTLAGLTRLDIRPVIYEVFSFDAAEAAYERLSAATHFGKLVIRVAA